MVRSLGFQTLLACLLFASFGGCSSDTASTGPVTLNRPLAGTSEVNGSIVCDDGRNAPLGSCRSGLVRRPTRLPQVTFDPRSGRVTFFSDAADSTAQLPVCPCEDSEPLNVPDALETTLFHTL